MDTPHACPACGQNIGLPGDVMVSQIVTCTGCQNRIVVESVEPEIRLAEAPAIEEDWGE